MPSSDRSEPRVANPAPETRGRGAFPQAPGSRPGADDGNAQFFDPGEPWDAQSAEALTSLYESADGQLWQRDEASRTQRRPAPEPSSRFSTPPAEGNAGLEERVADLIQTMQERLADLKPGKALDPINRRIDTLEQRLSEALETSARRSDVEGLRLIEAQVSQLTAHLEQIFGSIHRIDSVDDRLSELSRKFDEDGLQRLNALERTLQNYLTEWRHSDERSAETLESLDDTLTKISASIDAADAAKPAPNLSLMALAEDDADQSTIERDPLAHVYEGTRAVSPDYQLNLDAADYTPGAPVQLAEPTAKPDPAADLLADVGDAFLRKTPQPASTEPAVLENPVEQSHAASDLEPAGSELASPAFRASAIRARLQKMKMLEADSGDMERTRPDDLPAKDKAKALADGNRARPGVLLAAGVTLFAAAGYLLVDIFFSLPPQAPAHDPMPKEKRAHERLAPGLKQANQLDAIGTAIAAVFRDPAETPTPAIHSDAPATAVQPISPDLIVPPILTIGPASLRQAAMNGDAMAQYEVGLRYAAGRGVPQDMAAAFQWHTRAAARGLAPAQFRLAAMYERGQGTASDIEKARAWYLRAAEQGHVKAMHNLAVLSVGGGRSDYRLATKWFTEAAERGLADSQFNIAVLYQNGLGVPKDFKEAYKWLSLAARSGDGEAASRVASIKSQLSPADLQAADTVIAAWRVRSPDPRAAEPSSGLSE